MQVLQQMIQGGMGQGAQSNPDDLQMALQEIAKVDPQLAQQIAQMPQEQQMQAIKQVMQQIQGEGIQPGMGQPEQGGDINAFLDALPDDILQMLQSLPPDQQEQFLYEMMQMEPDELAAYVEQIRGGM